MTIDEAIKHCEEVAEEQEQKAKDKRRLEDNMVELYHSCGGQGSADYREAEACAECASEHRQLAEWLRELKAYRDKDMMLIYANPLAEAVRCAMCTNPMRSNSGCDGGCKVDEQMYRSVMDAVNKLIMEVKADDE